jgi:hypothetical protein
MATILRGKDKGKTVTIAQFCNDWFTVEESSKVFSATNLELNGAEMGMIINQAKKYNVGIMFGLYDLKHFILTGRFKKKKLDKTFKNKV